jgi:DNA-binding LytR/AlgR family response regulator
MRQKPKIKCLIIDDEPIAIRVIVSYIEKLEDFEISGTFTNALNALNELHNQPVDLLFLDIQMPGINGMEFFRSIKHPPKVIFTTAFRNYAADAFDLDALDYLVKPIPFDRFLKAINKFLEQRSIETNQDDIDKSNKFIIVKSNKKNHKINIEDILYIESLDDYIKIHLHQSTLICYLRLSVIEKQINNPAFIRVHRSFLINSIHVSVFTHYQVEIAGKNIPVGRKYRDTAIKNLNQKSTH